MTTTAPPGGHSVPLGLMSCVRESSPQDLLPQTDIDLDRNETSKKRRFHPFRGLRKMFRRGGKVRNAGSEETVPVEGNVVVQDDNSSSAKDSHRSRSTSELLAGDEPTRRKSNSNAGMYPGGGSLSVSHDSVFTAEQHSTRGDSTSSDLDTAQSSSSLSIQQLMHQTGVRAELLDVVRRRGRGRGDTSEDDEDLGLPRSPCNSPTTTDKPLKEHPTKSHSTCSDGSLLSMGSSEMDEDSFGQHSRHSSKLSLHDRRPSQTADSELELGTTSGSQPLSHSAARHKMSVRPKRTHGAPRRRRVQQLTASSALPTTPEVNEEVSTRSLTPEGSMARETIAELYSSSSTSMSKVWNMSSSVVTETQLKSASLPPGLALPSGSNKLSRSRSNAGSRGAKEAFAEEDESEDKSSKEEKKKEESFFGRFLARRSGKKKKSKSEDVEITTSASSIQIVNNSNTSKTTAAAATTTSTTTTDKTELMSASSYKHTEEMRTYSVDSGVSKVIRSGPAARQRIQPIDIPASPDAYRSKRQQELDIDLPMPPLNSSPEQNIFLESSPQKKRQSHLTKQTKVTSLISTSPEKPNVELSSTKSVPVPTPRTMLSQSVSPPKTSEPEVITPLPRTNLPYSLSPPKSVQPEVIQAPRSILPHSQSPPKPTWPETTSVPKVTSTSSSETKISESSTKVEECKTKVKISGLSSYQQRVMTYNDEYDSAGFKSLDESSDDNSISRYYVSKSQSFRSKSMFSSTQNHSSLPYSVNSVYDTGSDSETFTDSLMSTYATKVAQSTSEQQVSVTVKEMENTVGNMSDTNSSSSAENEVKIINTNADIIKATQKTDKPKDEIPEPSEKNNKTDDTVESVTVSNEKINIIDEKLENKDNGITISCVNSQVQASVNTKSSNQVIVSISNPTEAVVNGEERNDTSTVSNKIISPETSVSQISVTKVQLKRESKIVETVSTQVPEFLKIQLNKVDVKPVSNVVLSTSNSFSKADELVKQESVLEIETDRDSGEVVTDSIKRKFSTDDVEIIDKDMSEEIVEVPLKNVTVTNVQTAVKVASTKNTTGSSECVKKQLPTLVIGNVNNSQPRKSSFPSVSPTSNKPLLKKKSNSLELDDSIKKIEYPSKPLANSSDQLTTSSKTETTKEKTVSTSDIQDSPPDVILRKKSLVSQKRDKDCEEPELMKVFARRSLKLKDSDAETVAQQVMVLVEAADNQISEKSDNSKRDSDKENEGGESPLEERKKTFPVNASKEVPKAKEPLTESKFVETADVTLRKPVSTLNNKLSAFGGPKYPRAVSLPVPVALDVNENNASDGDKRKEKSFIEPKTDKKPLITNYRSHIMTREKSSEITKCTKTSDEFITNVPLKNDFENEDFVPMFKKIQQRKEEWEQRAQQNMKKSVP
ncbi:uncharacterized protein CBL_01209 [Carabus blaptoides fortunei]